MFFFAVALRALLEQFISPLPLNLRVRFSAHPHYSTSLTAPLQGCQSQR